MIHLVERAIAFNEGHAQPPGESLVAQLSCSSQNMGNECMALAALERGLLSYKNPGNIVRVSYMTDPGVAAWVDIAVTNGIRDMVVMGHNDCIAMKALLEGGSKMHDLDVWVQEAGQALKWLKAGPACDPDLPAVDQLSQLNVQLQVDNLKRYISPYLLERGAVRVHGWWYDSGQRKISAFCPNKGRFRVIDPAMGQEIIARLSA